VTELDLSTITERLDQLSIELRRQGRAAVAAQAAAESCLASVEQLDTKLTALGDRQPQAPEDEALTSLLPIFDALSRVAEHAEELEPESAPAWPLSLLRHDKNGAKLESLRQAVRLLDSAFHQAMEHLGVVIERRVGVALDPNIHRVVEARNPSANETADTVVEVRRCGYLLQGHVLREADVVATRSPQSK
jgi:molecular chaperone GrpE (heat shock protein)